MKRSILLKTLIIVSICLLSSTLPVSAQGPGNTQQADADAAGRAIEIANTILGLIQAGSILIGGGVALLGLIGFRNIVSLRETRDQFVREIEEMRKVSRELEDILNQRLEELQRRNSDSLNSMENSVSGQISDMWGKVEQQANTVRDKGERSIRALTLLQLGKQQMDSKNIDAALMTFKQAHKYDPSNRAVNYFMGELYINKLNDLDAGISHLKAAGAEEDFEGDGILVARAALAYAYRRKGDLVPANSIEQREYYHKAEGHFLEALKRNPLLLDIEGEAFYGALGGLYRKQGRLADAVECYEHAIEATRATSSYPYNNLGILYTMLRRTDKARASFERAIQAAAQRLDDKPQDHWSRFDMVTAQVMLGNVAEVQKHLPLALQSAPDSVSLGKFVGGLINLQEHVSSELMTNTIATIKHEIERRKKIEATQTVG